jgi:hypothetical protein
MQFGTSDKKVHIVHHHVLQGFAVDCLCECGLLKIWLNIQRPVGWPEVYGDRREGGQNWHPVVAARLRSFAL